MHLRDAAQELIELGPRGTLFRIGWEMKARTGLTKVAPGGSAEETDTANWGSRLQLEDPVALARVMAERIPAVNLHELRARADQATAGRILCFGRWSADLGESIDWHRSPVTGERWLPDAPWFRALADDRAGDVKYAWEPARFPQAYHLARAAAFFPERADRYSLALRRQIEGFQASSRPGFGIHWASGQEIGLRLLAWVFSLDVLLSRSSAGSGADRLVGSALLSGARHIEEHLDYARIAVYNNHLLSEALALFGIGAVLPEAPESVRWRGLGRRILDEQASRQFYDDGGYIQQSHNYHRVALQDYLWACVFARAMGDAPSKVWLSALERSLDFLVAHQNPVDGRLPNYGSNDGALPSVLSTCDFSDMRPTLQAISVLTRGERIYEPGPWDETTAWLLGIRSLDAPVRRPLRKSVSFASTGYHVLRGHDESSFAAFRCGTLRDRFSQIDMLHLDVWWRGHNVLVDPGSYQYNAAPRWHEHFMQTGAHNTVSVDGKDQMVHHRQFKVLYWTKAALLEFDDRGDSAVCAGEHYGYRRFPGACVHRRDVIFLKDDTWIVVDRVTGSGEHTVRLHWLGGDFESTPPGAENGMDLRTPAGLFTIRSFDADGSPLVGRVVRGDNVGPEGWLSRYYGEKIAVPSFAAERSGAVPLTMVSVLSGVPVDVSVKGTRWGVSVNRNTYEFDLSDPVAGDLLSPV
ncbi:MAG: alginate lyase family protein [Chloroflexota bacterium]|nr:MAG: alginate lyase family protein [Chloroflexota bacterium]